MHNKGVLCSLLAGVTRIRLRPFLTWCCDLCLKHE